MSRSDSGRIQDFGSTSLVPHILLSPCSTPLDSRLAGLEELVRTYTDVKRGMGNVDFETHAIQVLDEPRQIFALQARDNDLVLIPVKEGTQLSMKLRRGSVEIAD